MRTLTVLIVVAVISNVATAIITMEVVPVDNSSALTGYVTQDLVITTDSDGLARGYIIVNVGDIYQDDLGNTNPQSPHPAFFPHFPPSLEFDTYVTTGHVGRCALRCSRLRRRLDANVRHGHNRHRVVHRCHRRHRHACTGTGHAGRHCHGHMCPSWRRHSPPRALSYLQ